MKRRTHSAPASAAQVAIVGAQLATLAASRVRAPQPNPAAAVAAHAAWLVASGLYATARKDTAK